MIQTQMFARARRAMLCVLPSANVRWEEEVAYGSLNVDCQANWDKSLRHGFTQAKRWCALA